MCRLVYSQEVHTIITTHNTVLNYSRNSSPFFSTTRKEIRFNIKQTEDRRRSSRPSASVKPVLSYTAVRTSTSQDFQLKRPDQASYRSHSPTLPDFYRAVVNQQSSRTPFPPPPSPPPPPGKPSSCSSSSSVPLIIPAPVLSAAPAAPLSLVSPSSSSSSSSSSSGASV